MTEPASPKEGGRPRKGQSRTPVGKPLPAPSEKDRREGAEGARRILARRRGVQVGPDLGPSHADRSLWSAQFVDAFGTGSPAFASRMLNQLANGMRRDGDTHDNGVNAGLAVVAGLAPQNEVEAMLAVQMAATHDAALHMLATAKNASTLPTVETCGTLATKLLRTYALQIEALAKLRRGGEQKVTVEHVHVYPGGQAIVGAVTQALPSREGGTIETERQAHAAEPFALGHFTGALLPCRSTPLRGTDPERDPVPVAGGEGQATVPDARRRGGQRRSEG